METNEEPYEHLNCTVNATLVTVGNTRLSASAALKELHSVATQNLITSTQECIARQLSSYCDEGIEEKQNDCNLSDDKGTESQDDDEQCGVSVKKQSSSKKCQKLLVCKHSGCGRKFTWPAHYKYHQLTHTDNRPHSCKINGCHRNFFTAQRLAVHMRTHTGERPFSCTEEGCNKSFITAGNLRNHSRIHTGERPFACTEEGCDKSFTESSSLKKHQSVHSGNKPFICDLCGKTFSQCGSRNVHKRRHHNFIKPVEENNAEDINKEAGIPMCELPFSDSSNAQNLIVVNYNPEDSLNSIFETKDTSSTAVLAETTGDVILFTSNQEIVAITTSFSPLREVTDLSAQSRINS